VDQETNCKTDSLFDKEKNAVLGSFETIERGVNYLKVDQCVVNGANGELCLPLSLDSLSLKRSRRGKRIRIRPPE
jgi:hypothetical protein